MNKLLGFAILGFGAYYLYEKYYGQASSAGVTTQATGTSSTPTSTTSVTNTVSQPSTPDPNAPFIADAQKMVALMSANGVSSGSMDQLSYYYQAATGKAISPSTFDKMLQMTGGDRTSVFDPNYFMQIAAHNGLYQGLGGIAHYSRAELLYRQNQTQQPRFGNARLTPNDARKYERIM